MLHCLFHVFFFVPPGPRFLFGLSFPSVLTFKAGLLAVVISFSGSLLRVHYSTLTFPHSVHTLRCDASDLEGDVGLVRASGYWKIHRDADDMAQILHGSQG